MSKKNESFENTNTSGAEYSYNTNNQNNNFNNNTNGFKESVNRSLDEAKDNIRKSLDESKNQIPRINNIVNSYQEQSLQTAKEISEEYIDSQKEVINSLQSTWRSYSDSFNGLVNNLTASPESITKAYARLVSNFADNAVSYLTLSNNIIFSNMDSWKTVLQQAKDNSKHLSNLSVNAAKTFEQNSKEVGTAVKEATNSNFNTADNNNNTTTTSTTTKQ
jgi:hypothetical protein